MSNNKFDYLFKIMAMGETNIGKQAFLLRFIDDDSCSATFFDKNEWDFKIKVINFENKIIKLQIWGIGGEERFRTITKTYYKGAHGIILMYDVTDQHSFQLVSNWIKQIKAHGDYAVKKVLVGLKCDEPGRVVTEEQGKKLAEEYNIGFFESSAKNNKNVSEVFYYLVKEILIEKGVIKDEEGIKLSNRKNKKNQCSK